MNNSWYSYSVTDVGVKRSVNQDSIYADDIQNIWVVADGMGGHRDGDKASQAIVKYFKDTKFSEIMSERIIQIEKNIRALNTELQTYSTEQLNGQLIGSTMVVFTVCQGVCATIWAGDSRCYKVNNNKISQVSWDHSYIDELLRSGHMVAEEAATSKLSNVITRAVGAHEELCFDHVISSYSDEDTFLLCSDGLTNELSDKVINDYIAQQGCSQQSIDTLLNKTLEHGARDNVSIILIACKQRRPSNPQESKLIENFSNKLNTLADSLFNKEIELISYYQQAASIITQSISSHHQFKGQATQELPVIQKTQVIEEKPTAEFPKVTQPEAFKTHSKANYFLLLSVIAILTVFLFYLLLSE
jgi:serine/threonine protein phosphatase PrpC